MEPIQALRAILARAQGEYDDPALVAFGPLSPDILRDIVLIAEQGLFEADLKELEANRISFEKMED